MNDAERAAEQRALEQWAVNVWLSLLQLAPQHVQDSIRAEYERIQADPERKRRFDELGDQS